jgi:glutamate-ammonia-ligase adenylyltransferase
MRERVTEFIPAKDADRELKLGRGGLRDVEFAVQLLQMVHGRSDELVRNPNTLLALEQLATWGYVAREDAATLTAAYRFLRTLEHRIQVFRMRRTHIMPTDETEQRRIGRSMGYQIDPIDELTKEWKKHAREVKRLHEKLFYRPLLNAVVKLDSADARLSPEAAGLRLQALGYKDPASALRHIEALTSGVSRRAVIQRTLLPVMLEWFAQAPDPDSGLFGFRQVSEALGTTPWY